MNPNLFEDGAAPTSGAGREAARRTTSYMSRRIFIRSGMSALVLPMVGTSLSCSSISTGPDDSPATSRLTARPGTPTLSPTLGLSDLGLGSGRDGIMYVPEDYSDENEYPLFIGLHGAGGDADNWNGSYPGRAEQHGMVFVAPDSRYSTWDLMTFPNYRFGPDVLFLDEVLNYVFERCRIDPARIALGGFSDGASYSLSLGIGNGDLFTHLVAYSPGYYVHPDPIVGSPAVFVSHGPNDEVLSFDNTAYTLVPNLREEGYEVTFHQFEGGHEVPSEVSDAALDWFLGSA